MAELRIKDLIGQEDRQPDDPIVTDYQRRLAECYEPDLEKLKVGDKLEIYETYREGVVVKKQGGKVGVKVVSQVHKSATQYEWYEVWSQETFEVPHHRLIDGSWQVVFLEETHVIVVEHNASEIAVATSPLMAICPKTESPFDERGRRFRAELSIVKILPKEESHADDKPSPAEEVVGDEPEVGEGVREQDAEGQEAPRTEVKKQAKKKTKPKAGLLTSV